MRRITLVLTALAALVLAAPPAHAQPEPAEASPRLLQELTARVDGLEQGLDELRARIARLEDQRLDSAAEGGGGPSAPDITAVSWYADAPGGEVADALEALCADGSAGGGLFTIYGCDTVPRGEFRFAELEVAGLSRQDDFQIDLTALRPGGVGGPSTLAVHPFKGNDLAYSLFSSAGQPPQAAGYEHTDVGYGDLDHSLLWLVADDLIVVAAPEELFEQATGWTLWVSNGQWGFGNTYDSVELTDFEAPAPGLVAAPEPTTAATAEPSTTSTTSLAAVPIDDESGGSFSFLVLVPLVVGGVVIGWVGWRIFSATRERGKPGEPSGPAHAAGGDDDAPPRDTPAPVVYGEELDDGARCDWAVYWENPGGQLVPLRQARGHECCVYTIGVTSRLLDHAEAATARQAPELVGAAGQPATARLQAEEHGIFGGGLAPSAWATARSGPAGDQSWMAGLGERASRPQAGSSPATTDPALPGPGPLDAGSRVRYLDQARMGIRLDSGCQHANHFHAHGVSTATMAATYECTNGDTGTRCPVEVVAAGTFRAQVSGDLAYEVTARALHDPQEPAPVPMGEGADAPLVLVGSHDHRARPRADFEDSISGHGDVEKDADAIEIVVTDLLDLNAGVVVPPMAWDTTDRVSAALSAGLEQTFQIDAEMDNHDDGACCGRAGCDCAPKLRLVVAADTATIEVDGSSFTAVAPTWPASGGEQAWRI